MTDVLLYILGILIMLIGLAVSIGLHEVGHLLPAKLFGVKVTQYMIGFGKTIWSRRKGETEYGVKMIPLGGYIAMSGMFPPAHPGEKARDASTGFLDSMAQDAREASADSIDEGEDRRTFYRLPVWKKIVIMLGGPFMNLVLAFVFFGIVLMGFGTPQYSTTLNFVSQCVLPASSTQTECTDADPLAPAAAAGLQPGDEILAIDGVEITSWTQIRDLVSASPDKTLSVEIDRAGEVQKVSVKPASTERWAIDASGQAVLDANGEPVTETVGMIGVNPATEIVKQSITAVPAFVGNNVVEVSKVIIGLPERMVDIWNAAFGAEERDPNGPMGVVGVGRLAGEIVSLDEAPVAARAQMVLGLLGSLNVALFVFNLVPLMPLDGGHVAGALWEAIRRGFAKLRGKPDPGPVDAARFIPLTLAVSVILGAMTLLLVYADIVKPITIL